MNVKDAVRAKNVDLLIHSYNKEANKINKEGFINKDSKEVKMLRDKYDSLIARFDTDKNTVKKDGYNYKVRLDSTMINGIKGIKPNIKIRSET
jgi:cupin superfamily acireductone dioxygenase involved in methionine salvage